MKQLFSKATKSVSAFALALALLLSGAQTAFAGPDDSNPDGDSFFGDAPPVVDVVFTDRADRPIADNRAPEGSEAFRAVRLSVSGGATLTVTVKMPDGSSENVTVPAGEVRSEPVPFPVRPDDFYVQGDEVFRFEVTGASGGNFAAPPTLGGGTLTVCDVESVSRVTLELRSDEGAGGVLPEGAHLNLAARVDHPPVGGDLEVRVTLPDGGEAVSVIPEGLTERVIDVSGVVTPGTLEFRIADTGGAGKACYEKLTADAAGVRIGVVAESDTDNMLHVTLDGLGGGEINSGATWHSGSGYDFMSEPYTRNVSVLVSVSVGGQDAERILPGELLILTKLPKAVNFLIGNPDRWPGSAMSDSDPDFNYFWYVSPYQYSAGQARADEAFMRVFRVFMPYDTPHGAEAELTFEAFFNPGGGSFDPDTTDGLLPFGLTSGADARTAVTFSAITDNFDWNYRTTTSGSLSDMTISHLASQSNAKTVANFAERMYSQGIAEAAGVALENSYALTTSPGTADPAFEGQPYFLITPGAFFDADGAIPLIDENDADAWARAERAVRADASVTINGEAYVTAFTLKNAAPERRSSNAFDVPGSRFAWDVNVKGGRYNRSLLNAELAPGESLTFDLRSVGQNNLATAAVAFLSGGAVTTGPKKIPERSFRNVFAYTRADCGCGDGSCDCGGDCDCTPESGCGCGECGEAADPPPVIDVIFTDADGDALAGDDRIPEGSEALFCVRLSESAGANLNVVLKMPDGSSENVTVPAGEVRSEPVPFPVRPDDFYVQGDEVFRFEVTDASGGNFAAPPALGGGTLTVCDVESVSRATLELRPGAGSVFNADGTLTAGSNLILAVKVDHPPLGGDLEVKICFPDGLESVFAVPEGLTECVIDVSGGVTPGALEFKIADTGGAGKACYEKLETDDGGGKISVIAAQGSGGSGGGKTPETVPDPETPALPDPAPESEASETPAAPDGGKTNEPRTGGTVAPAAPSRPRVSPPAAPENREPEAESVPAPNPETRPEAKPAPSGDSRPAGALTRGERNELTLRTLRESGVAIIRIGGAEIPLFGPAGSATWALANLILSVFALAHILFAFLRRKFGRSRSGEETENKNGNRVTLRRLAFAFGLAAPVLFLFTEDVRNLMTLFDVWTIPTLALVALRFAALLRAKRAPDDRDGRDEHRGVG